MRTTKTEDPRYYFAHCEGCGHDWQFIDWGCARHGLYHDGQVPAVPLDQWQEALDLSGSPQNS